MIIISLPILSNLHVNETVINPQNTSCPMLPGNTIQTTQTRGDKVWPKAPPKQQTRQPVSASICTPNTRYHGSSGQASCQPHHITQTWKPTQLRHPGQWMTSLHKKTQNKNNFAQVLDFHWFQMNKAICG